jgi:exosortase C (VPDSG-CTERM-specific)
MGNDVDVKPGVPAMRATRLFALFAAALAVAFAWPLLELVRLALRNDLASHTLLIPFVSGYLVWLRKDRLAQAPSGARWPAGVLALAGLALLAVRVAPEDVVAMRALSFCLFLWGGGFACLGSATMRALAFPALFLVFMVPLPTFAVDAIETFFQHTSAALAFRFIDWSGTAVFREGLTFTMPGLTVHVGPECSGIRSSVVLFITSLLAGHLFLRSAWSRLSIALFVIPLGIVRNAFRVFVLSMLSVHVDPWWIHSPLHHRGGPIFFVLSLVPFFLFLWWLRRRETRRLRASRPFVS